MAAEIDLDFGSEPAQAEPAAGTEPPGKCGLGELHLGCDDLHPAIVGRPREHTHRGWIAAESAIGECVNLADWYSHDLNLWAYRA
jgi:hypothetical protein